MKKLSLCLDRLEVESFPTAPAGEGLQGTVAAAEFTVQTVQCGSCAGETCEGATCFTSCSPGGNPACTCPIHETDFC